MSELTGNLDEEVYTIQVDYGTPHYKIVIKEKKAYVYIYTKSEDLYKLKGYIDFKELLVDKRNPVALLIKTDDNRYVYIGHKIFTIAGTWLKIVEFICLKKGNLNFPYAKTSENVLYGFTENIAVGIDFIDTKYDDYFDMFHIKTLKPLDYGIMHKIYKEEIYDDSFYDKGIKPYNFSDEEIINMNIGERKVQIKDHYLKVDNEEYIPREIFIRDDTILALIDQGKGMGRYKYLFVSDKKKYEFLSKDRLNKYITSLDIKECHFSYSRTDAFFCFEKDHFFYIKSELNPYEMSNIAHLYEFPNESFQSSKNPYVYTPNLYYTHDNGGTPYRVTVDRKNKIAKVEVSKWSEDKDGYIWENIFKYKYINIFIGIGDDDEDPPIPGSSILLQTSKDTYILISTSIEEFKIKEQIKEFYSRVGNSDVFSPFAISDTTLYDFVYMKKIDLYKSIKKDGLYKLPYEYDRDDKDIKLFKDIPYKTIMERNI